MRELFPNEGQRPGRESEDWPLGYPGDSLEETGHVDSGPNPEHVANEFMLLSDTAVAAYKLSDFGPFQEPRFLLSGPGSDVPDFIIVFDHAQSHTSDVKTSAYSVHTPDKRSDVTAAPFQNTLRLNEANIISAFARHAPDMNYLSYLLDKHFSDFFIESTTQKGAGRIQATIGLLFGAMQLFNPGDPQPTKDFVGTLYEKLSSHISDTGYANSGIGRIRSATAKALSKLVGESPSISPHGTIPVRRGIETGPIHDWQIKPKALCAVSAYATKVNLCRDFLINASVASGQIFTDRGLADGIHDALQSEELRPVLLQGLAGKPKPCVALAETYMLGVFRAYAEGGSGRNQNAAYQISNSLPAKQRVSPIKRAIELANEQRADNAGAAGPLPPTLEETDLMLAVVAFKELLQTTRRGSTAVREQQAAEDEIHVDNVHAIMEGYGRSKQPQQRRNH